MTMTLSETAYNLHADGMSFSAIAGIMGCAVSTARKRIAYWRNRDAARADKREYAKACQLDPVRRAKREARRRELYVIKRDAENAKRRARYHNDPIFRAHVLEYNGARKKTPEARAERAQKRLKTLDRHRRVSLTWRKKSRKRLAARARAWREANPAYGPAYSLNHPRPSTYSVRTFGPEWGPVHRATLDLKKAVRKHQKEINHE